jgi:hypothetical protein
MVLDVFVMVQDDLQIIWAESHVIGTFCVPLQNLFEKILMSDVMVRVPMDDVVLMCPVNRCMQCIPALMVLDLPRSSAWAARSQVGQMYSSCSRVKATNQQDSL